MLELLLNLTWTVLAATSLAWAVRRRDRVAFAAALCALALLFPIISPSDDLASSERSLDSYAAVLAVSAAAIALVLVARLRTETERTRSFVLVVHADPRSPPQR